MILREWRARATSAGAGDYAAHFETEVKPALGRISGFRRADLARRASPEEVELVVLSVWESIDAIRDFAGPDYERAVVHPYAARILTAYDETVWHYDLIASTDAT